MNIELHGLLYDYAEKIGPAVWRQMIVNLPPEVIKNSVVTNVSCRSFNRKGERVPFIRVYSDKQSDFELARKLLKQIPLPGALDKKVIECVLLAHRWEE